MTDLAPVGDRIPAAHRLTAKEYIRAAGHDPARFALEALQRFGMHAARLARQEGWEEAKRPEDGFAAVHTWPRSVWDAIVAGERGTPGPATARQLAYLGALAATTGRLSSLLTRLNDPIDSDEAGRYIEALKKGNRS